MAVLFIQADQTAEPVSNAAADLDGSPLTACASTRQMSQYSGNENKRGRVNGNIVPFPDGRENLIGSAVIPVKLFIQKYNGQSGRRKEEKNPFSGFPESGRLGQNIRKKTADASGTDAGDHSKQKPFDKIPQIPPLFFKKLPDP